MRLWSVHPKYLDAKGLVALWREGLLARKVLLGETVGYRSHPQLERFRETPDPVATIESYLAHVVDEADQRSYRFDRSKLTGPFISDKMAVNTGQVTFEWSHLARKLAVRDPSRAQQYTGIDQPEVHPQFEVVVGSIASWERP